MLGFNCAAQSCAKFAVRTTRSQVPAHYTCSRVSMGLLTSAKSDCVSYNVDDAKITCIDWAEGYLVKFPGDSVNVSVCVIDYCITYRLCERYFVSFSYCIL